MIPEKSFQHAFPNYYAHTGPFSRKNQPWLNFHRRIFRAKAKTARLTITDWVSDPSTGSGQAKPGGPAGAGQELMFNFIEVQPYLEE